MNDIREITVLVRSMLFRTFLIHSLSFGMLEWKYMYELTKCFMFYSCSIHYIYINFIRSLLFLKGLYYYPRLIKSVALGDIILVLSVSPTIRSGCPKFQMTIFQWNLWKDFHVQVGPFNSFKSYCPWLVMHYVYRVSFISVQFLNNYWSDFSETLWEHLILRVDVHIFMFRWDHSN